MNIEKLAISIPNKNQEREFASFCKKNNLLKSSNKGMNTSEQYYYISIKSGTKTMFIPIQDEEFLINNSYFNVTVKRYTEIVKL